MSVKRNRLYLGLVLLLALAAIASTGSFTQAAQGNLSQSPLVLQATMAATAGGSSGAAPNFALCMAPTPTPGGTVAPTAAAPVATMAATAAAPAATMAATKPATKAAPTKAPTATKIPPTATSIPKGKKPASAGITLNFRSDLVRAGGLKCVNVLSVTAGGPGAVGGIKTGDLILGFDNDEIKDAQDFFDHVAKHASGDSVTVTVQRDNAAMPITVVLGLNPYASTK